MKYEWMSVSVHFVWVIVRSAKVTVGKTRDGLVTGVVRSFSVRVVACDESVVVLVIVTTGSTLLGVAVGSSGGYTYSCVKHAEGTEAMVVDR